ncbi:MAG: hypothetical protein ACE5F5_08715 [Acidimicrobiia bacterium]
MKGIRIAAVVAALLIGLAIPAMAASESGYKSCGSPSHVYTKARWKSSFYTWLDIEADGVREFYADDVNGGTWETDYANAYRSELEHGSVKEWINDAYYRIWGEVLSTWYSWPGCEDDA